MNILLKTKKFYDEIGLDMYRDITAYSINGYVFITPTTLLLGKSVRTNSDIHPDNQWNPPGPDAWYVRTAIEDDSINQNLYNSYLTHYRLSDGCVNIKKRPIKWYDFNRIMRRK